MEIRSLTRQKKDGTPYHRPPEIERQIVEVLPLEGSELLHRAKLDDQASADYLKEETFVYLIREHLRTDNRQLAEQLVEVLLRRCTTRIHNRLRPLSPEDVKDAYQDVVLKLFGWIVDLDDDRADYFQVRFWSGLKTLTIDTFERYLGDMKRSRRHEIQRGAAVDADPDGRDPIQELPNSDLLPDERFEIIEAIDEVAIQAIAQLDEPIRTAFVMRHYWDWPIESTDPDTRTISHYFGKTPRTIRNWLDKAQQKLAAWREETNDGTASPGRNS